MTTRRLIRLAACALMLCGSTAAWPPAAHAGTYQVRSCFPDGIDRVWSQYANNGFATAYKQCPQGISGSRGLIARNVLTSTPAPGFSLAKLYVNAPPGAYFDEIVFDGSIITERGWQAGLYDRMHGRWVWCGHSCYTFGFWFPFRVALATSSLEAAVVCAASQCRSDGREVGSIAMRNVTLRVRDVWNPKVSIVGGTLATPGWKRGVQPVDVAGSDNTGVRFLRVVVDGLQLKTAEGFCDDHRLVPCPTSLRAPLPVDLRAVADGPHTLRVQSVDASGNVTSGDRRIFVDNSAPGPVELASGDARWQAANAFDLSWINAPQDGVAPIAGALYRLCRKDSHGNSACGAMQRVKSPNIEALHGIAVPSPGSWRIRVWLFDQAGNENEQTAREATLRWDAEPPSVKLLQRRADDPARISVQASDPVSGIASAEIELRRLGDSSWHSLPVERADGGFSAFVNDEVLPPGTYVIRARARDRAGNERSTPATPISLPVRLATELAVGRTKLVRSGSRGHRRVLIRNPQSRYGRTIRLSGRLTSPGGNPLVARDVEIAEQLELPGAGWRPAATVRTDQSGRFRFRALPGPSRLLRFRYPGAPTIQGHTSVVDLRVRAASSLSVDRHHVVNGEAVAFRGRLKGEPIPTTGKLLKLQAFSRGHWLTFATPRANARGRWRHSYRFTATRGDTRYRFRVRIPRETGYPYDPGRSRTVRVRVKGL